MGDLFHDDTDDAIAGYAQVALEQGIDVSPTGLTYAVPRALAGLRVGDRVTVPLGRHNKPAHGYVIERNDTTDVDPAKVKPISRQDPGGVSLPEDLIELARWVAAYYCCPLGMVFGAVLPAAVKRGTGSALRTMVRPASPGQDLKLTKLQQAVLDAALKHPQPIEIKELADRAGAKSTSPVKQLVDKEVLTAERVETVVSDLDLRAQRVDEPAAPVTLNGSQQRALDHLTRHVDRFGVHLLHGVTGSGKTEVYLRLIESLMADGRWQMADGSETSAICHHPSAIVLVPEIALTPQTVARFVHRFPDVAVLHSGLTAAQRHAQWRRIRDGRAHVVVGARSAVFAPVQRLRLIIVDEEHDSSYKQDQLPRYHARDVAIKRAQQHGVPVVLGSATPSLESYHNARTHSSSPAKTRQWHLVTLPERVPGMKLPRVEIVNLIDDRRQRRGIHLVSMRLEHELKAALDAGGQAMLLLNRRGYANYIACPDHRCGWMKTCEHCDVTMVYHKDQRLPTGGVVRCHHCGAEQLLDANCPVCGKKVSVFGLGTQKVEEEVQRKLPDARVARMDSDTMRTASHYQDTLDAFRAGRVDVLLGTQMIAKGLDFPNVRLVGVISGDTSLHIPDFRAAERTFQLIAQVAGRAGRSDRAGKVLVQSFNPGDPTLHLAAGHDYAAFAQSELATREAVGLPPVTRMARIVVRDRDHVACAERAKTLFHHLDAFNRQLGTDVRLRGPAPCPIARVADFHRQQIELIADPPNPAATLQKLMTALRNTKLLISDMHTAVDVDPVSLL